MDDIKKIKKSNKKKTIFLVLTIIMFLGISLGAVYFVYLFNDTRDNELATGLISIDFSEGNGVINLENQVPVIDEVGLTNIPYEFTVKNTSVIPINLKLQLEPQSNNTINLGAVRYAFYIDNKLIEIGNVDTKNDNTIYLVNNFQPGATINGKLIFWVDYYYETPGETFSAKIKVTGESFDIIAPEVGSDKLKKAIIENTDESCNPIVTDTDGTIYFSGTNDCVDFNYVWYSGKLWRITSIAPDGTMKMITDDLITTINWGATSTVSSEDLTSAYSTSWIREWLNQEFLPTLYNYENIIVEDAGWYSITDSASPPTKPTGEYTLTDPVGLLNAYEYYMAYKNASTSTNYLNIGYDWWLITPYRSSGVRGLDNDGSLTVYGPSSGGGARPSINLKSTIQLSGGSGTSEDPYRIKGDIEEATANITLLNTRYSGEYIKLSSDETAPIFRIVDTELVGESLTTKIVLNDYVKESDTVLTKSFSSLSVLWSEVSATDPTYWRGYLNTTWLGTLDTSMLEKGTYYLGYHTTGSYKTTVCSTVSSDVSVKKCIENGTVVSNISSDDYVGLLRVGEMFASQTSDYTYSNAKSMWLITPNDSSYVRHVNYYGYLDIKSPSDNGRGARPSINLKSTILIKSGSGTKQDPFVVGLPS